MQTTDKDELEIDQLGEVIEQKRIYLMQKNEKEKNMNKLLKNINDYKD